MMRGEQHEEEEGGGGEKADLDEMNRKKKKHKSDTEEEASFKTTLINRGASVCIPGLTLWIVNYHRRSPVTPEKKKKKKKIQKSVAQLSSVCVRGASQAWNPQS